MSDPRSAGETPAAPLDPWTKVERLYLCRHCGRAVGRARLTFSGGLHCDSCDEVCDQPIAVMYATAVEHTAATERQRHAAQLAEKDYVIKLAEQHWTEYKATEESLNVDLTAAHAEIARLTEDAICATEQQNAAVLRAEAAETSFLALQQQMGEKDAHLDLVRDTANGWQANCAEKDAELLALRTDRSRWEAQHDRQVETILALRAAHAQLRDVIESFEVEVQRITKIRVQEDDYHLIPTLTAAMFVDQLRAALAASPPHPETEQRIDNGNSFVFCDAVQTTKGQSLCCVRGAGHSGPHAFVLPPIPLSPVILAYLNTGSAHPETEGP